MQSNQYKSKKLQVMKSDIENVEEDVREEDRETDQMQEVSEVREKGLDEEEVFECDKNESLGGGERLSDNGADRASSPSIQGI